MTAPRKGMRKCAKCERNRAERFYSSSRGRVCATCRRTRSRAHSRNRRILETYGLTEAEYDALFAAQDGACAICKGTRTQKLSVDHCHRTGAIRGLLCRLCNGRLLTAARDSPVILRTAADYLESYPCDRVLGRRTVAARAETPGTNRRRKTGAR